jgi:hypothetical protein
MNRFRDGSAGICLDPPPSAWVLPDGGWFGLFDSQPAIRDSIRPVSNLATLTDLPFHA